MSTLVDSNVLIDTIEPASIWHQWSAGQLAQAANSGAVVVNQVVLAETSEFFGKPAAFEPFALQAHIARESIPWEACYEAGRAHVAYRKQGGRCERTLPDFLIGAHALIRTYKLLTRDPRRYRGYFPSLEVIAPDTHP